MHGNAKNRIRKLHAEGRSLQWISARYAIPVADVRAVLSETPSKMRYDSASKRRKAAWKDYAMGFDLAVVLANYCDVISEAELLRGEAA